MPILAIFTGNGISQKMYEALRQEVGWESRYPAGAMFHAAGVDQDGHLHVADVWDSPEAMDAFVKSRLMPAMQKLNVPPPSVAVYPTINVNAYAGVDKHRLR